MEEKTVGSNTSRGLRLDEKRRAFNDDMRDIRPILVAISWILGIGLIFNAALWSACLVIWTPPMLRPLSFIGLLAILGILAGHYNPEGRS